MSVVDGRWQANEQKLASVSLCRKAVALKQRMW